MNETPSPRASKALTGIRASIVAFHQEIKTELEARGGYFYDRLSLLESKQHKTLDEKETEILRAYLQGKVQVNATQYSEMEAWLAANIDNVDPGLHDAQAEGLADLLLLETLPIPILDGGYPIIPAKRRITKNRLHLAVDAWNRGTLNIEPSPIRNKVWQFLQRAQDQYLEKKRQA